MYYNLSMQFLIITSCTRRKRVGFIPALSAGQLIPGTHREVARQWVALAKATEGKMPADQLYVGRAIKEVKVVAKILDAQLSFASTGFGLIDAKIELPNYDLTVADPTDAIRTKVVDQSFSSQKWWASVNRLGETKSLALQLEESPHLIILMALPKAYLALINHELAEIPKENSHRLRVFTSPDNLKSLPECIRDAYIPYDERFDGVGSPVPGTRSDYPQRVMRHFAEFVINKNSPDLDSEKKDVLKLLSSMNFRKKVERQQVSDDEIRNIVRQHLDNGYVSAAKMLRVFRDDLLIACEQKRFARIFRELNSSLK